MTKPFMINVGDCMFTALKSILERSPLLNAMLSCQWADSICYVNKVPFVDRSPLLFEHILDSDEWLLSVFICELNPWS